MTWTSEFQKYFCFSSKILLKISEFHLKYHGMLFKSDPKFIENFLTGSRDFLKNIHKFLSELLCTPQMTS